jgi:hypothetical protein
MNRITWGTFNRDGAACRAKGKNLEFSAYIWGGFASPASVWRHAELSVHWLLGTRKEEIWSRCLLVLQFPSLTRTRNDGIIKLIIITLSNGVVRCT